MEENKTISQEELEQLKRDAEQSDAEAQFQLGEYYYKGEKRDYGRALAWYLKAAEAGHLSAQKRAAEMYQSGKKIGKNVDEAARWWTLAAEQGDAEAQFLLGEHYSTGRRHEYGRALEYYKLAAEQGCVAAKRQIGYLYMREKKLGRDTDEAVKWMTIAAEEGDAEAQYNMGRFCYIDGDYKRALAYLIQAGESGHAMAQCNVGVMYMSGTIVKKDINEAIKWLALAAEQREEVASLHLTELLYKRKDKEEALRWAIKGGVYVLKSLGERHLWDKDLEGAEKCFDKILEMPEYVNGEIDRYHYIYHIANDFEECKYPHKAFVWWMRGAEMGYPIAQNIVGGMFEKGRGVEKDYVKAVYWYAKAAEAKSYGGMLDLARCYELGRGVEKSLEKSADLQFECLKSYNMHYMKETAGRLLLRLALKMKSKRYTLTRLSSNTPTKEELEYWTREAEQGNVDAQQLLGVVYYTIKRNKEKGNYWLTLAAEQGDNFAQRMLDSIAHWSAIE